MPIVGTSGPDLLPNGIDDSGGYLQGLAGDDTLRGNGRGETLEGGQGDDLLIGDGMAGYANASGSVNVVIGASGPQHVGADQGTDTLVNIWGAIGGAYNDTLTAGSTDPLGRTLRIYGGGGDDRLEGGSRGDTIDGGDGADTIVGGNTFTVFDGQDRTDTLFGGSGNDSMVGGLAVFGEEARGYGDDGDDLMRDFKEGHGGAGNDTISGLGTIFSDFQTGSQIYGETGDDSLTGTDSFDLILGGSGLNSINAGADGDTVYVFDGSDFQNPSDDRLYRRDVVDGGGGQDWLNFVTSGGQQAWSALGWKAVRLTADMSSGTAHVEAVLAGGGLTALADVTFKSVEGLIGTDGDDSLVGSAAASTLEGGLGADSIQGGDGAEVIRGESSDFLDGDGSNTLHGGAGNDWIEGGTAFNAINGNQGDDTVIGNSDVGDWLLGGQGNDLVAIEASDAHNILNGNLGNDTMHGGSGGDFLRGGQGQDIVVGGSGDDWITGDRGNDTLTGGDGSDIFHVAPASGVDVVTDFDYAAGDRLQIEAGMKASAVQQGADVVVDFGSGNQITLNSVTLQSLGSGWILTA